jgi:hypothetical protein
VVAAHYTYTGPRHVHKPAVRGLGLSVLLLVASGAEAGWLIVDENGDQTLISRGRLKMSPKQADGHSMVLDLARARMWVADAGRKLYWDGTVEEYCQAVRGTMAATQKIMAEQMKDMPPAQREPMQMLKQMGGQASAGTATAGGRAARAAGRSRQRRRAARRGRPGAGPARGRRGWPVGGGRSRAAARA